MMTPATSLERDKRLAPPTDAVVADALATFANAVREYYGARLRGIHLFGSRARRNHRPDSDADVAVVLADGDWAEWVERRALVGLAYPASLDSGLTIQAWPIPESAWRATESDRGGHAGLVEAARRDARPLR
jgi:hypothetical protein